MSKCATSKEFGAHLRGARQNLKLTTAYVADQVGVTNSYIQKMESMGWIPRKELVERLADLLKADKERLLISAGYSNENIQRGYLRHLDAIAKNKPIAPNEATAPLRKVNANGQDLLNAFSTLISEHESLKTANAEMSMKLNKILEAVK